MDENYIKRCLELAARGLGKVAPNPLVGAVVVHNETVIGEGYHEYYGGPHAEVNAINSVKDKNLISGSNLYVNLEPCVHHGKTPPCVDLIIEKKIKTVVIGTKDPFHTVAGKGIEKLESAGIEVIVGVLEKTCTILNRRFFTFYSDNRPYIILKWAQSADGFIAPANQENKKPFKISNAETQKMVHLWRSQEQAILVGKGTILKDNPALTVRLVNGKNPIPFILGLASDIPKGYKILKSKTIFFENNVNTIKNIISYCLEHKILSIMVEGGAKTLSYFIENNFWDEARIITNPNIKIETGILAPKMDIKANRELEIGTDLHQYIINPHSNA